MGRTNDAFESYILQSNASFRFNEFIREVENGCISNDGCNKLLNLIDRFVVEEGNQFHRTIKRGKILYRARIVYPGQYDQGKGIDVINTDDSRITKGFNEGNSREAPLGKSCVGRNNIQGVSYLYLADKESTACVEVKPYCGQLLSVAKFEVKKPLRIVDFAYALNNIVPLTDSLFM